MKFNSEFNSFMINQFTTNQNCAPKKDDGIKYHYTSPDAMLSIIKNRAIRFTDIRYLNDRSEDIYLVKVLLDFLDDNKGRFPRCEEAIYHLLKSHSIEKLKKLEDLNITFDVPLKYKPLRKFVFCTCEEADSINMWNYYINNEKYQGYSIGFNVGNLLKSFDTPMPGYADPFSVLYGKVLYTKEEQNKEIESLFEKNENRNSSNDFNYLITNLRLYIDEYGAFFKHPKFSVEKEYRLVLEIADSRIGKDKRSYFGENNKKLKYDFTTKEGLVVPYMEAHFDEDSISRIYTAPTTEYELAKDGVRQLLKEYKYKGVQTHQSDIPIRF